MIFKGSRYERLAAAAYTVMAPDGHRYAALPMRVIPPTPATVRHTIGAYERLDLLAYHYYRNPQKFWLIADANDEMDPDDLLEVGRQILVPPDRGA